MSIPLPGVGGLFDTIEDVVKPWITQTFNSVVQYIWEPLRGPLVDIFEFVARTLNMVDGVIWTLAVVSEQLLDFFANGPSIIAEWVIESFLEWVDAVLSLVTDWIDEHWDDPI